MSSTKPLEPKVGLGPNSAITGVHAAYGLLAVAWLCVGMKLSLKVIQDRHKWKAHDYFAMLATVRIERPSSLESILLTMAGPGVCYSGSHRYRDRC